MKKKHESNVSVSAAPGQPKVASDGRKMLKRLAPSVDEMIKLFDIADVNQSASSFNPEKLLGLNQQHIMAKPGKSIGEQLVPYLQAAGLAPE